MTLLQCCTSCRATGEKRCKKHQWLRTVDGEHHLDWSPTKCKRSVTRWRNSQDNRCRCDAMSPSMLPPHVWSRLRSVIPGTSTPMQMSAECSKCRLREEYFLPARRPQSRTCSALTLRVDPQQRNNGRLCERLLLRNVAAHGQCHNSSPPRELAGMSTCCCTLPHSSPRCSKASAAKPQVSKARGCQGTIATRRNNELLLHDQTLLSVRR